MFYLHSLASYYLVRRDHNAGVEDYKYMTMFSSFYYTSSTNLSASIQLELQSKSMPDHTTHHSTIFAHCVGDMRFFHELQILPSSYTPLQRSTVLSLSLCAHNPSDAISASLIWRMRHMRDYMNIGAEVTRHNTPRGFMSKRPSRMSLRCFWASVCFGPVFFPPPPSASV